jgi:outer membrane receptor protein involved in Fe transport
LSDPDGRYEISGLPAGTYTVTATRAGYVSNKQPDVEVTAGAAVEVALTLAAAPDETVVVTASRMEADLQGLPTAVTVVPSAQLETAPATKIGDLMRTVPGLNVVQTSARDINMASRQASPQLTNSQIALIDGRTIYSDFYDIIYWDLVPLSPTDVKQIEVVRRPASAVWGANATTGVINIITRSPRESPGTTVTLMGGGFSRDAGSTAGDSPGGFGGASVTTSQVINDRWAFRASAGYSFFDPYPRPIGRIPISTSPVDPSVVVGGGSYGDASFANAGTRQPKFDLRFDQEIGTAGRVTYEGGIAGSQGIIHTPIGPFKMEPGTYLGYSRVAYDNGRLRTSSSTYSATY